MRFERRRAERVRVNLDIQWARENQYSEGTISDISVNGCFVLCSGIVADGEKVRVKFKLPHKKILIISGEIVNHVEEIGFGMKFDELGKREASFVKRLIERARVPKVES